MINESLFYHHNLDPKELDYAYEQKLNERKLDIEFLPVILNYMHRINVISRKSLYTSLEKPFEGVFVRQNIPFDASGFTSVGNANKEATVVVFDVKINNEYKWNDFSGFKYRVETLINSTKKYNQRVIPVIVANEFEHGKYLEVKADNRFMILQLRHIFGSRIQDFLDTIKISKFGKMSDAIKSLEILDDTGLTSQLFNFFTFCF